MPFVDPFGEQSGGGSPPTTVPRLASAPASSGGGFVDPFASGGGGSSAAPAAAPAHHGGGLFGFLGGNVVKGAIGGLENLVVHQVPTTVHNTADIVAGAIHGGVPQHLVPVEGEGFEHYLARTQGAAGAVLAAPEGLGHDVAHPTEFVRNPAQSGLDLLGTAALVAGPVAGKLGGAAAEASASAAEAGSYATAVEGAAARGVASEAAAQAARQAADEAAAHAARLGRLSAIADPARAAINRGSSLPFLPVELAGKAVGAVARPLADAASATRLGGAIADVSTRMGARAAADRLMQAPSLAVKREAGLNTRAAAKAVGRDADHEQAVNLIQTGTVPALRSVLGAAEHSPEASTAALDRLGVSPRAAQIAADYTDGTLAPKDTAAMDKALGIREGAVERRAQQYGSAEGAKTVAQLKLAGQPEAAAKTQATLAESRAEQFGNQPMTRVVDEVTAKERAAVDIAQQRVLDTQGMTTPGNPNVIPDAPLYHGTSQAFEGDVLNPNRYGAGSGPDNLYGPGVYTTENKEIAKSYTSKGAGRAATEGTLAKTVYGMTPKRALNLIDLDRPLPPVAKMAFQQAFDQLEHSGVDYYVEDGTRLQHLIDSGAPGREVYAQLKEVLAAPGTVTRTEAAEILHDLNDELEANGFHGFTHLGGKEGTTRHQVSIVWDPENLSVVHATASHGAPTTHPDSLAAHAALDVARSRLATAEDAARASTAAAPAKFRPAIVAGQRVASVLHEYAATLAKDNPDAAAHLRQLADETPATLEALNAAGVDPQHLIGELADTGRRMSGGRAGAPVRVRGTGEEKQKLGGSIPARLADAARLEANRGVQVVRNLAAPRLQAMFGRTATDVLGDTADMSGEQLASAMYAEREKWVPWDPSRGRPGVPGRIDESQITARTTFIPEQAARVFDGYWQGNPKGPLAKFVDWTSRGDKGLRLALNPSIHAAYMVGNLVMELPAVGPKLIPNLFRAAQLLREEARTGEAKVPARLMGATFGGVERAELEAGKAGGRFGGFRTPLGLAESKGYALMDLSDRVQRVATYLTKKGEGFTDEAAVRQALAINGDFASLSPFEANVLKRVWPGFSWTRHITQLAFRLPIEHPLRVAWMLSLAQNDNTGGNVPWWMNPFESAFRVGQFHPLIRAFEATQGKKTSGLDVTPISHSAALGSKNKAVPLWRHPAQLAYALERFEPQGKLEQALRLAPVRRYGTGEPVVTSQGRLIAQPGGKLGAVKAAAGFGSYSPTASSQKAQARTAKSDARASLSYQRRLRAAKKRAPVKG